MMKPIVVVISLLVGSSDVTAFSLQMGGEKVSTKDSMSSRRSFLSTSVATIVGGTAILSGQPQSANAAPEIFTTDVSYIFSNVYIQFVMIDIPHIFYYLLDKSLE